MPNNTFNEGIEPGGLRDENEIKILICYLLKKAEKPLTFDNLNDILQNDGLVNYFGFAQSLHELLVTGHIDIIKIGGQDYYKVTRLGSGTADMFERNLPLSVRQKALRTTIRLLTRIRHESENKVTITDTGRGFCVECRVLDGSDELMAVRLLLPEREQAEMVKRQFLESPDIVYKGTIALLTGDPKTCSAFDEDKPSKP